MEESRPCTCGGSNENCYRCSGTGILHSSPEPSRYRPLPRKRRPADVSALIRKFGSPTARKMAEASVLAYMVRCDRCGFRGLPEEVQEHKRTAHSEKPTVCSAGLIDVHKPERHTRLDRNALRGKAVFRGPASPESPKASRRSPAGQSGSVTKYRMEAIARGLIKPANPQQKGPVKSASKAEVDSLKPVAIPIKGRHQRVRCSRCHAAMKAESFAKHIARVHGLGGRQQPKTTGTKRRHGRREKPPMHVVEPLDPQQDLQIADQREAHRQMGFVVRENGRYGSHPLHDRFDDESEP